MKAGDHVGILATNCIEWVEALFAIYKIRASAVNINFRYVEEELRYLFENSDVVACFYQREYGPLVAAARSAQPQLQHFVRIEWNDSTADDSALDPIEFEAAVAAGSPVRDFGERSDDDIYLLYTGGTTGKTDETVIQDQTYVGSCPTGMKPGDRISTEGALQRYSGQ